MLSSLLSAGPDLILVIKFGNEKSETLYSNGAIRFLATLANWPRVLVNIRKKRFGT
jgi:hypothetical protein